MNMILTITLILLLFIKIMYTIIPSQDHINITFEILKGSYTEPFKKNIKIKHPDSYVYDNDIKTIFYNKHFLSFIRYKNIKTNDIVYFILTSNKNKFKFITFLKIKNIKKNRYSIKKNLKINSIFHIDIKSIIKNDKIFITMCIWINYNDRIEQYYFIKTDDMKWSLVEKRIITSNTKLLLNLNKNIISMDNNDGGI